MVTLEITSERIRQIGNRTGNQFTSKQAEAFLLLHGSRLADTLDTALVDFVKKKLE